VRHAGQIGGNCSRQFWTRLVKNCHLHERLSCDTRKLRKKLFHQFVLFLSESFSILDTENVAGCEMALDPSSLNDVAAVRRLLANAQRLNRPDIVSARRIRIYELSGDECTDPVERRLWQAVAAYEEILRDKHGRHQPAAYTRRKIASKGVIQTLIDWALDPNVTPGFEALVAADAARYTGEYVVVEFADRFPSDAVAEARKKLEVYGVPMPEG
jgi:hypothetical protein